MELEATKNEVLRKVGRNVLLYQQLEHILKYLVSSGQLSGSATELKGLFEQKKQAVGKMTMGTVAGQFFDNFFQEDTSSNEAPEPVQEVHLSFDFRIEMDTKDYESRKGALASLVADRNSLIHHLLPKLAVDSLQNWLEVDRLLDQQRDKILPQLQYFREVATNLSDGRKEMVEFIQTEEGLKHFFGQDTSADQPKNS